MSDGDRGPRLVWWISGVLLAGIVGSHFLPKMKNPAAPRPRAAYLAIQPTGAPAAVDGALELEAGTGFRLFAVLEAETWRGERVYYTEAPALRLGGEAIAAERLRRWPEGRIAKIRWLTVEGFAPYLRVEDEDDLARFALVENFHPEWGSGWSAEGIVDPRLAQLDPASPLRPLPFGVQRYEARIELFDAAKALTPSERYQSPGPERFLGADPRAPRVVARIPGRLAALTASFGRVEIDTSPDASAAITSRVDELVELGLAFVRSRLLARHLAENDADAGSLPWRDVVLGRDVLRWGDDAAAGDLIQVGSRVVALYGDAGEPGRVDAGDLVIDLDKGLHLRHIDDVFTSEGALEVSFAHLGG